MIHTLVLLHLFCLRPPIGTSSMYYIDITDPKLGIRVELNTTHVRDFKDRKQPLTATS